MCNDKSSNIQKQINEYMSNIFIQSWHIAKIKVKDTNDLYFAMHTLINIDLSWVYT